MRNPLNSTSWIRLSVAIVLAFTVVLRADAARASGLPGFTLVGEDWTYDPGDGGTLITGKLIQPTTGSAPHPAVLISHGQGGGASGFSAQKAAVMRTWGLVCIAPNYTHVDTSYPPGTDGWSTENERRARACLTILASRADVDMARVAAYGNSKGAFVTAGLCGATLPGEIRAAAITAGGTSGTTDTSLAAPATQEVQGISAPFLLLHGADDTTVSPNSSALLDALLSTNGIPHQRFVWSGVGHDLHAQRSNDVYALLRAWFSAHGVLGEGANTPPSVSALADVAVPVDTVVGPLAFTIGDAQSAASALVVSALSLDIGIVPPANIALAGSAANRSVQLTPAAGATTRDDRARRRRRRTVELQRLPRPVRRRRATRFLRGRRARSRGHERVPVLQPRRPGPRLRALRQSARGAALGERLDESRCARALDEWRAGERHVHLPPGRSTRRCRLWRRDPLRGWSADPSAHPCDRRGRRAVSGRRRTERLRARRRRAGERSGALLPDLLPQCRGRVLSAGDLQRDQRLARRVVNQRGRAQPAKRGAWHVTLAR